MAIKIKPKRGTGSPAGSLEANEIAMDTAARKLYVSTDGSNAVVLAENISNNTTDDLTEGSTNLYYTDARADARAQLKIDALVDGAPGTLDTLNEIAAAINDDADVYNTLNGLITTNATNIAAKLNTADFNSTFDTRLATKDTGDLTEGSNLYYTDARAQAVSINNVVEDTTPQLGGDLDLNGNFIQDGGNDVLEVDSGALKLYHDGDLQITTGQYETTFEKDVVSTGFFCITDGYDSRILRQNPDYDQPCLTIGSEGTDAADVNINFELFDGGFGSSDRTATVAQVNTYRGSATDNRFTLLIDDNDSLVQTHQHKIDDGDIIHTYEGELKAKNMIIAEADQFSQLFVQRQSADDGDPAVIEFTHDDNGTTTYLSLYRTQKEGINERKTVIRHVRDNTDGSNANVYQVTSNLEDDTHEHEFRGNLSLDNQSSTNQSNNISNTVYIDSETNHDMVNNLMDFRDDTPTNSTAYKQNFNFRVDGDNVPSSYQFGRIEAGYVHNEPLQHYIRLNTEDEDQEGQNFLEVNVATARTNAPFQLANIASGTTDPASPVQGQYFFNTTNSPSELKRYNGTSWDIITDEGLMFYDSTETRLTVREGSNWVRYTNHVV